MTKQEEIEILTECAAKLGADSYMGPWLKDQIPFIADSIESDMFPISIQEGDRIACNRVSDAERDACAYLKRECGIADVKATQLISNAESLVKRREFKARALAGSVLSSFRALEGQLEDLSA